MSGIKHVIRAIEKLTEIVSTYVNNQTRRIFSYGSPVGFVNRDDVTLSWDGGIRTLTISPAIQNSAYDIYINGELNTKTESESIQISDTHGLHFIYFDDLGVLQEQVVGLSESPDNRIFNRWAIVATIQWSPSIQRAIPWPINEFHGYMMDASTHIYLHNKHHTAYIDGLTPAIMVSDATGGPTLAVSTGAAWVRADGSVLS